MSNLIVASSQPPSDAPFATPEWLCRKLLQRYSDLKAYVAVSIERDADFDLKRYYGLDPAPLRNLNPPSPLLVQRTKSVFSLPHERLEAAFEATLSEIRTMLQCRVLGANTGGKMAFVHEATGTPLREIRDVSEMCDRLVRLRTQAIELLNRQYRRLGSGHPKSDLVRQSLNRVRKAASDNDLLYHQLRNLCHNDPRPAVGFESFTDIYRDEILQVMADAIEIKMPPGTRYLRKTGIEVAYACRDCRFLELGDTYGDCTASNAIPHGNANIFQTVYAWMLDPYYRVLEVYLDGDPMLKGHILPLVVNRRPCLVLDAVETVPKLRRTIKGRENQFLSRRAWKTRDDLMAALQLKVFEIADQMGTDCVLAEQFSNTEWVRCYFESCAKRFVRVSDIEKPFGNEPVRRAIMRESGGVCHDFHNEIQILNTALMDIGLRPNYKELALLRGNLPAVSSSPVSGP